MLLVLFKLQQFMKSKHTKSSEERSFNMTPPNLRIFGVIKPFCEVAEQHLNNS